MRQKNKNGFTLIEVSMIIILIGVLVLILKYSTEPAVKEKILNEYLYSTDKSFSRLVSSLKYDPVNTIGSDSFLKSFFTNNYDKSIILTNVDSYVSVCDRNYTNYKINFIDNNSHKGLVEAAYVMIPPNHKGITYDDKNYIITVDASLANYDIHKSYRGIRYITPNELENLLGCNHPPKISSRTMPQMSGLDDEIIIFVTNNLTKVYWCLLSDKNLKLHHAINTEGVLIGEIGKDECVYDPAAIQLKAYNKIRIGLINTDNVKPGSYAFKANIYYDKELKYLIDTVDYNAVVI